MYVTLKIVLRKWVLDAEEKRAKGIDSWKLILKEARVLHGA